MNQNSLLDTGIKWVWQWELWLLKLISEGKDVENVSIFFFLKTNVICLNGKEKGKYINYNTYCAICLTHSEICFFFFLD